MVQYRQFECWIISKKMLLVKSIKEKTLGYLNSFERNEAIQTLCLKKSFKVAMTKSIHNKNTDTFQICYTIFYVEELHETERCSISWNWREGKTPVMPQHAASAYFLNVNTFSWANYKLSTLYQKGWIRGRCA